VAAILAALFFNLVSVMFDASALESLAFSPGLKGKATCGPGELAERSRNCPYGETDLRAPPKQGALKLEILTESKIGLFPEKKRDFWQQWSEQFQRFG
jgi:hypothetical protein